MKINNHKISKTLVGEEIEFSATKNKGGEITPEFIIIHFTAGRSAESSVEWFKNQHAGASAHVVISRDGKITQLVEFNIKAWHAGRSRWAGKENFNNFSIGIELDNPGRLTKVNDRYYSWFKKEYNVDNVIAATHKHEKELSYWHNYTEAQMQSCFALCKELMMTYDIKDILGHDDIAPYRKSDPGPAFPMESFRAKLIGRDNDTADIYTINSNNVNIRKGAGTEYDSLGHLQKGKDVEFVSSKNGWFYVYVLEQQMENKEEPVYGWIHNSLLTKKANFK